MKAQTIDIMSLDELRAHIDASRAQLDTGKRLMVAIAGAPASGKSTLAESLANTLSNAVVVPMDGFHLDNALLEPRGDKPVKGAPHTFDVEGFCALIQRLTTRGPLPVYIPVFDRTMDLARNAASLVRSTDEVVIVEGNYLLLDRPGWRDLLAAFDVTVMLDVPLETLRTRLVQRWLDQGFQSNQALERATSNDIPNARTVLQESVEPHLRYKSVRQ